MEMSVVPTTTKAIVVPAFMEKTSVCVDDEPTGTIVPKLDCGEMRVTVPPAKDVTYSSPFEARVSSSS